MFTFYADQFCSPCLRFMEDKWMNVQVGDIIKMKNNQFVPVSTQCSYRNWNCLKGGKGKTNCMVWNR